MALSTSDKNGTSQISEPLESSPDAIKSIFDVAPEEFTAKMDKLITNRNTFLKWVDSQLISDIDYQYIKFGGKPTKHPTLLKAGAEKICSVLGVIADFPSLNKYESLAMEGKELNAMVIKCILYHDGKKIGEGAGGRSLKQDRNDLNKYIKMCLKSAYIDAVIRTFGMGSMFTQDLDDQKPEKKKEVVFEGITKAQEKTIEGIREGLDEIQLYNLENWLGIEPRSKKSIDQVIVRMKEKVKENKKKEKVKENLKASKVQVKKTSDGSETKLKLELLKETAINLWMVKSKEAMEGLNQKVSTKGLGDTILDLNHAQIDEMIKGIEDGDIVL